MQLFLPLGSDPRHGSITIYELHSKPTGPLSQFGHQKDDLSEAPDSHLNPKPVPSLESPTAVKSTASH